MSLQDEILFSAWKHSKENNKIMKEMRKNASVDLAQFELEGLVEADMDFSNSLVTNAFISTAVDTDKDMLAKKDRAIEHEDITDLAHPEPAHLADGPADFGVVYNANDKQKDTLRRILRTPTGTEYIKYAKLADKLYKEAKSFEDKDDYIRATELVELGDKFLLKAQTLVKKKLVQANNPFEETGPYQTKPISEVLELKPPSAKPGAKSPSSAKPGLVTLPPGQLTTDLKSQPSIKDVNPKPATKVTMPHRNDPVTTDFTDKGTTRATPGTPSSVQSPAGTSATTSPTTSVNAPASAGTPTVVDRMKPGGASSNNVPTKPSAPSTTWGTKAKGMAAATLTFLKNIVKKPAFKLVGGGAAAALTIGAISTLLSSSSKDLNQAETEIMSLSEQGLTPEFLQALRDIGAKMQMLSNYMDNQGKDPEYLELAVNKLIEIDEDFANLQEQAKSLDERPRGIINKAYENFLRNSQGLLAQINQAREEAGISTRAEHARIVGVQQFLKAKVDPDQQFNGLLDARTESNLQTFITNMRKELAVAPRLLTYEVLKSSATQDKLEQLYDLWERPYIYYKSPTE